MQNHFPCSGKPPPHFLLSQKGDEVAAAGKPQWRLPLSNPEHVRAHEVITVFPHACENRKSGSH